MALRFARVCRALLDNKSNILKYDSNFIFRRSFARYESDPAPYFFSNNVQDLLNKLTKRDMKKIFRAIKLGEKLQPPIYKFMTTEEVQKVMQGAEKRAERKLQMPPIVQEYEEINEILSSDPALKGLDDTKFVFTDITFGVTNRNRLIVVREPDGTLRKAYQNERHRMNQVYFPQTDRQLRMPHMFEEPYIMEVLNREEYLFILDRACVQFEPDDPEYHRVTSMTYDHVNKRMKFDILQSTRHFGPLCFYLCWHKNIDNFVLHFIQNNELECAMLLIKLFHCLHPESKSCDVNVDDALKIVQSYIEKDSEKRSVLELALNSFIELERQREIVEKGIKKAHGLSG